MGHWLTRAGQIEPCVYRPGVPSRYEIIIPTQKLTHDEVDELHADGARRSGWLFYKTDCPTCNSCTPLRIELSQFHLSKSQRRVWRTNEDVRVHVGPPEVCTERVELYNKHLFRRGLNTNADEINRESYSQWLVESGIGTLEFSYHDNQRLLGVGLVDIGSQDASSVYFYFDPDFSKRSLGVFSMLKEIEWLQAHQFRYHYLGFYNNGCKALRYKAAFGPHELLDSEQGELRWQRPIGGHNSQS